MSNRNESNETLIKNSSAQLTVKKEMTVLSESENPNTLLQQLERYQKAVFLGQGGMGQVYKAYDPRLNRFVALKFIHNGASDERFLKEAQLQARVEHENICKVYEVDKAGNNPYIAMQYINGKALGEVAKNFTLEQKVKIIAEVAEAVHAAHRVGLIHRDIKPANIMVESNEFGVVRPYVMDFGLARDCESQGQTETGTILGTPAYMSPEQARGDINNLDRRTDVYSLGATLYEILVGTPPFTGASKHIVLMKVIEQDATSARKVNITIPRDLDTIVMKCLEKAPQQRYESALALAEDLRRFLNGEPLQTKPISWFYRTKRLILRNRAISTLLASMVVIIVMFIGVAINAQHFANEQAQIGQQFGQKVKEIESILRYAYMSSLHNTDVEKAIIKARMTEINQQMQQLGDSAKGPGNYALGRGYLLLNQQDLAYQYLLKAWQSGYHAPEVAYALGQTMGELYRKELETLSAGSKERREIAKKLLDEKYRQPALEYLKLGVGTVESPAFVEGQIAFYKEDFQLALDKAHEAHKEIPWLYEAQQLAGNVNLVLARQEKLQGHYEEAKKFLALARTEYLNALENARSDNNCYETLAESWMVSMEIERDQGLPYQEPAQQANLAIDNAIKSSPNSALAYSKKANVLYMLGEYKYYHGQDPNLELKDSIEASQQAINNNPQELFAYNSMGNSYWTIGAWQNEHDLNPTLSFENAIRFYEKAINLNGDFENAYSNLGGVCSDLAAYQRENGIDPQPILSKAVDVYTRLLKLNSKPVIFLNNQGVAYHELGQYQLQQGLDPHKSLEKAIQSFEQAHKTNPNYGSAYVSEANTCITYAKYQKAVAGNAKFWLEKAISLQEKALTLKKDTRAYNSLAEALILSSELLLEQNINPSEMLTKARNAVTESFKINQSADDTYISGAQIELTAARWAVKEGRSPEEFFNVAKKYLADVLKLNSHSVRNQLILAEFNCYYAEWLIGKGQNANSEIVAGLNAIEQATAINPHNAEINAIKARLLFIGNQKDKARNNLELALKANPLLKEKYEPILLKINN